MRQKKRRCYGPNKAFWEEKRRENAHWHWWLKELDEDERKEYRAYRDRKVWLEESTFSDVFRV